MELKLVYRTLRKISDWVVTGYYSDILVEGRDNVAENGPLIIASTHHNEIIDIATLAATIPHRRHLSFWAKSTMFKNPIAGAILSSSGAIPVKRNPNNGGSATSTVGSASASDDTAESKANEARSSLFWETSNALAANQAVGVFPEGTSYTHSKILQTMPGAAWAAVEYAKSVKNMWDARDVGEKYQGKGNAKAEAMKTNLTIVPVAIVYTDKAKYLSRVYVRYGEPIVVDSHRDELFEENSDAEASSRAVVKKIMGEIESKLIEMTINAPSWERLCSVKAARNILWGDEDNIPLENWVEINQSLVKMFSSDMEQTLQVETALAKYYALLHHTKIKHSVLTSLIPNEIYIRHPSATFILSRATFSILINSLVTILQFAVFLPPFALFLPAYISGQLAARFLTVKGEEEAQAQFKAVGGGLGVGLSASVALGVLSRFTEAGFLRHMFLSGGTESMLKQLIGVVGVTYLGIVMLIKWHNCLIQTNYRQLQRLIAYCKLFSAFILTGSNISPADLTLFTKPPLPAANAFIKKSSEEGPLDATATKMSLPPPKTVSSTKLVRHLLDARADAYASLSAYLRKEENETFLNYFVGKGAKLPSL